MGTIWALAFLALTGAPTETLAMQMAAADQNPDPEPIADEALFQAVAPFPARALTLSPDPRQADRMRPYYESIQRWGEVLAGRFEPVPNHPEWGYYGRGGNQEDDVRPITYAAFVNAFLARADGGPQDLDDPAKARCRREAIAALAYLTQAHKTGPGACLNGKPWGGQWQSAMWTRSAALAAWLLWEDLDPALRLAAARMAEHEADRFLAHPPKSSEFKDTGAEENAWNAGMLALAAVMMPAHPRSLAWDEAAKRYLYNSLSMQADADDPTPGDDDRPISDWVTTVNAHPDATVENHGLVHVGYLKTSIALMLEAGSQFLLAGDPPPRACLHHAPEAFENLCACMAWDGAPIYFGGNDWKLVHTQASDALIYAMLGLFAHDRAALRLEQQALDWAARIQREEEGFYNVRRDIEYGGLVTSRYIACYMAHAMAPPPPPKPLSSGPLERRLTGVRQMEYAQAILHRTPTKFASFSWGPKRMALALPENGSWTVWPHYASYLGLIAGQDPSRGRAEITALKTATADDAFIVAIRLNRLDGAIQHDAVFVSPPGDLVFYLERITLPGTSDPPARRTGVIGHEYPLGSNERTLYFSGGRTTLIGEGNKPGTLRFETDWLNIGDRLGYIIKRRPGCTNIVHYIDQEKGEGRVPKLQEWFSLIGEEPPIAWPEGADYAGLVTCLNQTARQTAKRAKRTRFEVENGLARLRNGSFEVQVDFDTLSVHTTPGLGCTWQTHELPAR